METIFHVYNGTQNGTYKISGKKPCGLLKIHKNCGINFCHLQYKQSIKHEVMWIESVKCLILLCVASSVKCSTNGINKLQYATMCVSSPLEY